MKEFHPALLEHFSSSNQRAALAGWGLALAAWGLLSLGAVEKTPARTAFFGAALVSCLIAKPVRSVAISTERTRDDIRDISTQSFQNWLYSRMKPDTSTIDFKQAEAPKALETYDFDSVLEEATGIALLGNSGSGKSSVAKYICGLMGETQILVLDPHDDGETWGQLPVISEYAAIVEQLELLLLELDKRRGKRKKKQRLDPVAIISDEWPAIREYCSQIGSDVADRFLLRFGSEARKFNMMCIFCSQSGNTKALGLEGKGDFLENFMLIRLHKVARKYAKNLSDRSILERIQPAKCGYPCLVGDEVSIHPTHGQYAKCAKGLPPRGLKVVLSLKLTIKLACKVDYWPVAPAVASSAVYGASEPAGQSEPNHSAPAALDPRTFLESLWHLDSEPIEPTDSTLPDGAGIDGQDGANEGPASGADAGAADADIEDRVLRDLILEYRAAGINGQDAFIEACWGIKKGSANARYIHARDRYQAVCKLFGL